MQYYCNHSHGGSRAQSVDALFIPIFAMVMTSRMSLYVMLMSSYVFLNSLHGCGGCDGEKYEQCLKEAGIGPLLPSFLSGESGTTAPGRMLEDDYSDISLILAKGGKFAMKQVE